MLSPNHWRYLPVWSSFETTNTPKKEMFSFKWTWTTANLAVTSTESYNNESRT